MRFIELKFLLKIRSERKPYITLDAAEGRITEQKDKSKEFTQNKKVKNIIRRLRDIRDRIKRSNIGLKSI